MVRLVDLLVEVIEKDESKVIKYEKRLSSLPKGSIRLKKRNTNVYHYLRYYDSTGKQVDKYIRECDIDYVRNEIEERKGYEEMVKGFKDNIRLAKKGVMYGNRA